MTSRSSSARDSHPKRRKVAIACEQCRNRKARCDGHKPVCGACTSRSQQCIYKVSATETARTNEYVESLVNRIAELEQQISTTRDVPPAEPSHGILYISHQDQAEEEHTPTVQGILPATPSSVDAMGANMGPADHPAISNKFYGSSSALSFMRQIYSSLLGNPVLSSSSTAPNTFQRFTPIATSTSTKIYVAPEHFSLLPRHLADQCLALYWNRVHILYPFLHVQSFKQAYEELWKAEADRSERHNYDLGLGASNESGPSSVLFHCALNAALALGMQFSDLSVNEKSNLTSNLLEKSKNLLKLDLFHDGSIALVQTLLLLTQYFQSMNGPNRCWSTIGVACRLAQGLGLYIENGAFVRRFNSLEREIRRRVWHGCVTLDIAVSMTLGRPPMLISDASHPLPEPFDDEWIHTEDAGAPVSSKIDFFVETIKLYRLLERILLDVYKVKEQHSAASELPEGYPSSEALTNLDKELSEFSRCVPAPLSWTQDGLLANSDPEGILLVQSHVLHVRFLHAHLLLYRPSYFQYCQQKSIVARSQSRTQDEASDFSLANVFGYYFSLTCIRTSIELIRNIEKYSESKTSGAWWYNMYYTRTAAMVVLLAGICPELCAHIGEDAWESAWTRCRNTLVNNLPQYPPVRICLSTLEALRHHILWHRSRADVDSSLAGSAEVANTLGLPRGFESGSGSISQPGNFESGITDCLPDQLPFDPSFDPFSFFDMEFSTDLSFGSIDPFPY